MTVYSECDFHIEPVSSVAALEERWRALGVSGAGSFFTSWDWISCWLTTLPESLHPALVTAMRGDQLAASAIAFRNARTRFGLRIPQLHFNTVGAPEFDCITVEYNDFAGEAGLLPNFVHWFAAQNGQDVELVLPGIAGAVSAAGTSLIHSQHMKPGFANRKLAAIGREGLGSVLSRNTRQQLAKSLRDFEALGKLAITEAANTEEAVAYFDALKELHISSFSRRRKTHAFRYPYFETFHRALIARGMPNGSIQLLRISAGERLLGYLYNFRYRNRVYAYQSGFSDEDWSLRPGYVCHAMAMELNARQGVLEYDFLAGENQLKSSLSETEYELGWHTFARPSPIIRLEAVARGARRLVGR